MSHESESPTSEIDPVEAAKERYRLEREKRLRSDGLAQYSQLDDYEEYDHDPWVEPGFTREPVVEETTAVIVGGDFGGTWYWNRYPGVPVRCRVLHLPAAARRARLRTGGEIHAGA
jgi:hypothetical protein